MPDHSRFSRDSRSDRKRVGRRKRKERVRAVPGDVWRRRGRHATPCHVVARHRTGTRLRAMVGSFGEESRRQKSWPILDVASDRLRTGAKNLEGETSIAARVTVLRDRTKTHSVRFRNDATNTRLLVISRALESLLRERSSRRERERELEKERKRNLSLFPLYILTNYRLLPISICI